LEYLFVAVLIFYLIIEAAEQILLQLNLKHLAQHGGEVPPGFEEYVDAATLRKMRPTAGLGG
jgi:hypothetical protein